MHFDIPLRTRLSVALISILAALCCPIYASAATPWWQNSEQLAWSNFTALPTIDSQRVNQWKFAERQTTNGMQLAAVYCGQQKDGVMMISASTASPAFRRVATNYTTFPANFDVGYTSIAATRWTNSYKDFFVGTGLGILEFNETTELLDPISLFWWDPIEIADRGNGLVGIIRNWGRWSGLYTYDPFAGEQEILSAGGLWGPWFGDPTYIRSIGTGLYCSSRNWGFYSGDYVMKPSGIVQVGAAPGTSLIWGDRVSGKYGRDSSLTVRNITPNASVLMEDNGNPGGWYSVDGEESFHTPVGVRSDGHTLYVSDFYIYSSSNIVIVKARYQTDDLLIGQIGGTLYPANAPLAYFSTMFYSPKTRLLIVGACSSPSGSELYYTILPPEAPSPSLSIANAVIVSWPLEYSNAVVQCTADLTDTNWTDVTIPRVTVGDSIQFAVPTSGTDMFFRMVVP